MNREIILDIETTYTLKDGRTNPSPYLPENKLVSVGIILGDGTEKYWFFHHQENTQDTKKNFSELQEVLDNTDTIIGHNLKFDMAWLFECGFKYSGGYYDTMICEYIDSRGLKRGMSLKDACERHNLDAKKDLLAEYIAQGVNVDAIPMAELEEYGLNDIRITKQLYDSQQALEEAERELTKPAKKLMNELLSVLIDMERNGVSIDEAALEEVDRAYREEAESLRLKMLDEVSCVMGDTPINLESTEQIGWVIYSRKVRDKDRWAETFNLGSEIRNSVSKKKYPRDYPWSTFKEIVKSQTDTVYKTDARQCWECCGSGSVTKTKKDGSPFSRPNRCKTCDAKGIIYETKKEIAGFKVMPIGSKHTSLSGFSTDKHTLALLLEHPKVPERAKNFIASYLRYNAVQSYLSTFVEGIRKGSVGSILHTSFNQCITATGRLSSSAPNVQNYPREKTFPVRKVFKSRFKGGKILDCDLAQLEFRVAVLLAQDKQGAKDIIEGIDVHQLTAETIGGKPKSQYTKEQWKELRDEAKKNTFRPLYGGVNGSDIEMLYFKAFIGKYKDIASWQQRLAQEALEKKRIISPSGRIYSFPFCTRRRNGSVSGFTQIVNYCVQGFATGDLLPALLVDLHRRMLAVPGLQSKLILTVHDSITADVHPEEIDIMISLFKQVFDNAKEIVESRFNIDMNIPIGYDLSIGDNWLTKEKVA